MTFHTSYIETKFQSNVAVENTHVQDALKHDVYRGFVKRVLDVLLVLVTIPTSVPLVFLFASIILVRGGKPFYSQLRIGHKGKHYRIWKLRTMVQNADQELEKYLCKNPAARVEWETTQKLKQDPRITTFGRILRKTSLDELPQLWNVLNGTMSLVGPRPMMIDQQNQYPGKRYYNLRPGITGLWQVSERNESSFRDRAKFDDAYDRDVSLKTDLRILRATVGVVVRGTGH